MIVIKISIFSIIFFSFKLFAVEDELSIISWNIRDFGKSRDDSEIKAIANLLRRFDLVAIQEVVAIDPGGAKAVGRLVDELDRMGANWDYAISDPTQSPSSYISERYAFLWKESRINIIGKPRLLHEVDHEVFREPFLGKFKFKERELTILNYHSRTHDAKSDEYLEILAISNWILKCSDQNVVWLGDFNLEFNHIAFDHIYKNNFISLIKNEKTTLKNSCDSGSYFSRSEDNILCRFKNFNIRRTEIIDFVEGKCSDLPALKNMYSDHLPINFNLY